MTRFHNFTPGKWVFIDGEEKQVDPATDRPFLSIYAEGFEIARVHGAGLRGPRANARLIAAAPEMVEVLEMVERHYSEMVRNKVGQWEALRNALDEKIRPTLRAITPDV